MHVALILAKEGSKGLPNKHLISFKGTSLLRNMIQELKKSCCFEKIYVSTNGESIASEAKKENVEIIMRPNDLAANERYVDAVNFSINKLKEKPSVITIPQVVQPLIQDNIFDRIKSLHGPGVDSVVTVTRFESSVEWIFQKDENSNRLKKLSNVAYGKEIARRDDLFIIDNAIVSFTVESWKKSEGITAWPYLGKNIVAIEQKRKNIHFAIDINTPEDAEWLEFIQEFPKWKQRREGI